MKAPTVAPRVSDFCFPALDTLIEVEAVDGAVVIRASRDTFSDARRKCFLRDLAAEGFISDEYHWRNSTRPGTDGRVQWRVAASCFQTGQEQAARTRRFMLRLLSAAVLVWLLMMAFLVVHAGG